uniref:Nucleolar protein 14-like n=1 Tax=Phallusia mammillata TaxID=59560 RepID=A0A6F9DLS7_9ASCI|nr:nucleolar protein 14-like [Phallusia mammillata]
MAKKKKGLADKVRQSKLNKKSSHTLDKVRNNPFEIKINKQKHNIIGRKTKHDRGLPGVSKSKANKKRKDTLLKEYKQRNKTNAIRDERFGNDDSQLSLEEKMLQRFSLERKKKHEKMAQFNLNEDEDLTHLGQSLSNIEKFDDYEGSDNEEESGTISGEYVTHAHFGGGIFSKKEDGDEVDQNDESRSRKDIIDEIIAKSKKAKYEKQATKEKSDELRDKLDDTWNDFEKLLRPSLRTNRDKETARESSWPDDYDMTVKQMLYERKVAPTEKVKTEEELKLEQEEARKAEEESRIRRMQADFVEGGPKTQHQSADALEEDYYVSEPLGEDIEPLSFGQNEDEDSNNDDENSENSDAENDQPAEEESELGDLGIEEDDDGEVSNEQEDDSDDYSDIDSGNEDDADITSLDTEEGSSKKSISPHKEESVNNTACSKFPVSYADFASRMSSFKSDGNQAASKFTSQLRKQFAPNLRKGNKARMVELFAYVWEHCCKVACNSPPNFSVISSLTKHLYELCAVNSEVCCQCIVERMKRSYQTCFRSNKSHVMWPSLDVLIQFKLIKSLFSTSDFCHPVVTPAFYFMCNLLNKSVLITFSDVSRGLFICTLIYEYVSFSKRLVPECINYLVTVLCLALPTKSHAGKRIPTIASTRFNQRNLELLKWNKDFSPVKNLEKADLSLLVTPTADSSTSDEIRNQLLSTALSLTSKFLLLYSELTSFDELVLPVKQVCEELIKVPCVKAQPLLLKSTENVAQLIASNASKPRKPISFGRNKPKPLRLIDPKIEDTGEPFQKRSRKTNPSKKERERLLHKCRREMKGAVREIRKDNRFIARQKQLEQDELDAERAARVKRLYGLLSNQEGEVRNIQHKKYKLEI